MPYKDPIKRKEANKIYQRKHYAKNKQYYIDKARQRKRKSKWTLFDYKEKKGCFRCGIKDGRCLAFHHERDKENNIATLIIQGYSIKKIMEEVKKCKVMCNNCHSIHHFLDDRGLVI